MKRKPQEVGPVADELTLDLFPLERVLRTWPKSVSEVARWCRHAKVAPLPESEVRGTNDHERSQLAALGGIAAALATQSNWPNNQERLPYAVQKWIKDAPTPPPELARLIHADLGESEDPLALVYERIVAGPRRRKLGTFFTPRPVLEYVRSLVMPLRIAPRTVADPGAGVGAFSLAALEWWQDVQVHAVDVNLVTLGLLATRPDLLGSSSTRSHETRLQVQHEDFLEWLNTRWRDLPSPRLILGNPPYTRHQQLTASEKYAARALAGPLVPGARAGLSTYFLSASLAALGPRDALCLLLPANWLEADYARSLRKHLWEANSRAVELHVFPNELNVFPGAQVSAMILIVGPERKNKQPLSLVAVDGGVEGFKPARKTSLTRNGAVPKGFTVSALDASNRIGVPPALKALTLGDIAVVRRGVATGANEFFLRTEEEVNTLPPGTYVPAVSRLRDFVGDVLDNRRHAGLSRNGVRCWLLNLDEDNANHAVVKKLIDDGAARDIDQRYLCKVRKPWFAVERIAVPDILVGPMGKESFRIVINKRGATPTNTLYGIRLRNRSSHVKTVTHLARWLQSEDGQDALRNVARKHHGDGLVKLEPRALAEVQIPHEIIADLVDRHDEGRYQ